MIDLEGIRANAEDGLDPRDGLTAEEALARILILLNERTVGDGYATKHIQMLTSWAHGSTCPRGHLEDLGLVRAWTS